MSAIEDYRRRGAVIAVDDWGKGFLLGRPAPSYDPGPVLAGRDEAVRQPLS